MLNEKMQVSQYKKLATKLVCEISASEIQLLAQAFLCGACLRVFFSQFAAVSSHSPKTCILGRVETPDCP